MQKFVVILLLLFAAMADAYAQTDTTAPVPLYLQSRQLPGFKLLLTDSVTNFYKYQLKKKTPTVIVYFNPDCEHCKHEAQSLKDSISLVKNIQFVFASYSTFGEIRKFDSIYQFSKTDNIKIGRDEQYYIPTYYKVKFTPFVAVYNKDGYLIKAFEGGTNIKNLAAVIKQNK